MDGVIQGGGVLLVCLAVIDLYLTVLYARGDVEWISRPMNRAAWALLSIVARFAGRFRERLLSFGGSLLIVLSVLMWGGMLVCGFALIAWPELGEAVQSTTDEPTPHDFATAVYFAGFSLTTLGTGDLAATSGLFRVLMVVQAALGFSFLTLSFTYVMSVYDTLRRRNAFALSLDHQSARSGDPSVLLSQLLCAPIPASVEQELSDISAALAERYEDHHFYPILLYFRFREPRYAMPRMLYVTLDSVSLVRSALHREQFDWLIRSGALETVWQGGIHGLQDLSRQFLSRRLSRSEGAPTDAEKRAWRAHFDAAVARLERAGVTCRVDSQAAFEAYVQQRQQWDATIGALSALLHFDRADVAPTAARHRNS